MTASNRPRTPVARQRVPRRPACVPASSAQLPGSRDGERALADPASTDGLKVTIRVIPLSEAESNPLRAQQLAVIVALLRRAATEAAARDATSGSGGTEP
jgi:hypothetical protein